MKLISNSTTSKYQYELHISGDFEILKPVTKTSIDSMREKLPKKVVCTSPAPFGGDLLQSKTRLKYMNENNTYSNIDSRIFELRRAGEDL